ncbi:DUF1700 domain-containing protein [Silvimonas amylolytica]|uniref:DUF1700 domain-containing protein n=1 Tax=Silvimonas amylolytica TaxID=449663 RepID=A0ABQ2PMP3_9NEIS|nr:DUF1700 domain-containing protein [Silvimonas amylolytica]GGP26581.1 hypothetical protein GCM10010971_24000 [Silvimonas amylolytica]
MNQKTFLLRLRAGLGHLPPKEVDEIVGDYEEFFRDGLAEGHTEEEIAERLGDPERIAKELHARTSLQNWEDRKSFRTLWQVVLAYAGLGALNFVLAIPLLIWLLLLTAGFMTSGAVLLGGVICTILGVTQWAFDWPAGDEVSVVHSHAQGAASGTARISINDNGVEIVGKDAKAVKDAIEQHKQQGDSVEITANKETGETEINIHGGEGNVHISTHRGKKHVASAVDADIKAAAADVAAAQAELDAAADEGDKGRAAGQLEAAKAREQAAIARAEANRIRDGVSGPSQVVTTENVHIVKDGLKKEVEVNDDDEGDADSDNAGEKVVKRVLHTGGDGSDKLLPIGLFLLAFGAIVLLLTLALARWTARTVSRFVRYQLDLLGVGKQEENRA